ncbi:MAG: hypothetical protein KC583_18190 [Myxococcales bacterium]|nr:hypothetical protein [Myxococcales bacterium]
MRIRTLALCLAATGLTAVGCSKKDDAPAEAAKPDVKWPDKPANGAPLALEFVRFEGEGEKRRAVMNVFNFADVSVTQFVADLQYRDKDGNVLKTFPHTQYEVFTKKSVDDLEVGFFMPPETTSVTATILKAKLSGQDAMWEAPAEGGTP